MEEHREWKEVPVKELPRFTNVPDDTFQWFDVEFGQGKDTAYTAGSGKLICNALPRREDNVVIFTEEGYIQDAKYGSIWQKG